MVTVTIEEMCERLPDLLENVKQGEDVLITQGDQPFARLVAVTSKEPAKRQRQLGLQAGKIHNNAAGGCPPLGGRGMLPRLPKAS